MAAEWGRGMIPAFAAGTKELASHPTSPARKAWRDADALGLPSLAPRMTLERSQYTPPARTRGHSRASGGTPSKTAMVAACTLFPQNSAWSPSQDGLEPSVKPVSG